MVSGQGRLNGFKHLFRLILTLVEVAEVDVSLGCFACGDSSLKFRLCGWNVLLLFGDERQQTVGLGRKIGLHSGSEGLGFIEAATYQGGGCNVVFAKVAHGLKVFGIELYGALEFVVDFDGETQRREGAGMGGFESVGASEPHVVFATVGRVGYGQFTLVNGGVRLVLGVVDAAEELVGVGVVGLRGESARAWRLRRPRDPVGGACWPEFRQRQEAACHEEEGKEIRMAKTERACRKGHGYSTIFTGKPIGEFTIVDCAQGDCILFGEAADDLDAGQIDSGTDLDGRADELVVDNAKDEVAALGVKGLAGDAKDVEALRGGDGDDDIGIGEKVAAASSTVMMHSPTLRVP